MTSNMAKVHVALKDGTSSAVIDEVIALGKMTNVNEKRALAFGILTGDVPCDLIDIIRTHKSVVDVDVDSIKTTSEE